MDPEDEAGEVEAGAGAAAAVLAGLTTVAIVVGTAAGGVEVVVECWMNSALATDVELLDGTTTGAAEEVEAGAKVSVTDEPADEAVYEGTIDGEVVEATGVGTPGGYCTPIVSPPGHSTVTITISVVVSTASSVTVTSVRLRWNCSCRPWTAARTSLTSKETITAEADDARTRILLVGRVSLVYDGV